MRSYDANQIALLASDPSIFWLFEIDKGKTGSVDYYYATNTVTYNAQAYTGCIIEHSGIKQMRPRTENRSVVCLDASFVISDAAYALTPGDLEDAYVTVRLIAKDSTNEEQMAVWKLTIKRAESSYGKITCHCVDFLQEVLEGSYPLTEQVATLYPSDVEDKTGLCVPVPIGIAYLPITSFYYDTDSTRYYMLGPSANTYTVYAVHSPASAPVEEWVDDGHGGDYNLEDTVSTVDTDWKVLEPEIVDSDNDGTADAVGFWLDGDSFDYMCCRFSRDDTASLTSPDDAIDFVLQDMGVASTDIDVSEATATYAGWSLTFNGGWVSPYPRAQVIADLLCECHSTFQITDKVELHPLSKTAQGDALTTSDLKNFRYSKVTRSANDSSYIAWQEDGKPQDRFKKSLVAAKSATDNPSSDTFQIRFVQDSQNVQRIGSLRNQRRFLRAADVSFTGLFKLIRFQPADVISINDNVYGGSYSVMLDQVWIKSNGDIAFSGTRYSEALDDWSDLSPVVVNIATDDSTNTWRPVYAGPDTGTGKYPNLIKGRVRVNDNIIFDPTDGITLKDGGNLKLLNESNSNPAVIIFEDEYSGEEYKIYTEYYETLSRLIIDGGNSGTSNLSIERLDGVFINSGRILFQSDDLKLVNKSGEPGYEGVYKCGFKLYSAETQPGGFVTIWGRTGTSYDIFRIRSEWEYGSLCLRISGFTNATYFSGNVLPGTPLAIDVGSRSTSFDYGYFKHLSSGTGTILVEADMDVGGIVTADGLVLPEDPWGDYEEGEWDSPYIEFGGGTTDQTYSTRAGTYTTNGNRCHIQAAFVLTDKGSDTGNARIVGLPFTSNSSTDFKTPITIAVKNINTGVAGFIQGYILPDSDEIALEVVASDGTVTTLTDAHFADDSEIYIEAAYLVDSYVPVEKPVVETNAATDVEFTKATLNGDLTSLGSESSVDVYFAYRIKDEEEDWTTTTPQTVNATGTFDEDLTSLTESEVYEFRAVVEIGGGEVIYGDVLEFDLNSFKIKVDTTKSGSASDTIKLPIDGADMFIDWGDSNTSTVASASYGTTTDHTYASGGEYTIKISTGLTRIYFNNGGDKLKLIEITDGGRTAWSTAEDAFEGCTNLTSIPSNLFQFGVSITSFYGVFYNCTSLKSIPSGLFDYNVNATTFAYAFGRCSSITSIPWGLFDRNVNVSGDGFEYTFDRCSLIWIPSNLFDNNTGVDSFVGTFYGNSWLISIPEKLFAKHTDNLVDYAFDTTFSGCNTITSIPENLFKYNTSVRDYAFRYTFYGCDKLETIPANLFKYNVLARDYAFYGTFGYCPKLEAVPEGLFDYNVDVGSNGFRSTFEDSGLLKTIPQSLFKNNINCTSWRNCFKNCHKLTLIADMFYNDGDQSTRFSGQTVDFSSCFDIYLFTGTKGTAPDLWNCDGTLTGTGCFSGHSGDSLTNFGDIPSEWK